MDFGPYWGKDPFYDMFYYFQEEKKPQLFKGLLRWVAEKIADLWLHENIVTQTSFTCRMYSI